MDGLIVATDEASHSGRTLAPGDIVEGQKALSRPWMRGLLGKQTKVLGRLAPLGVVDSQHPPISTSLPHPRQSTVFLIALGQIPDLLTYPRG